MGGNKLVLIIVAILMVAIIGITVLTKTGLIESGTTYGATELKQGQTAGSVDDLRDGSLYIWQNGMEGNIEAKDNIFSMCPEGDKNITYDDRGVSEANFTVWISPDKDDSIPTLTSKDKLIYISSSVVPDTFNFLRMYENGYSIGVTSLVPDASNHYFIRFMETDKDDYKQYVNTKSDAKDLGKLTVEKLYLEKVGGMSLTDETVSESGIVTGLNKDEQYVCEFYTGTYYQDFLLTANIHTFTEFEDFTCYGYEFLHSNCISINIPDWLCSGYYYINGIGLFRYVADKDITTYNGKAYDENIAWNEPLIQYDEFGRVSYDPSQITFDEEVNGVDVEYEDTETEANSVSNTDVAKWSYTLKEDMESFSAEIKTSSLANQVNAKLIVTLPNGDKKQFDELNNVIAVQLDNVPAGAYAFNLVGISGRTFDVTYSTGDTYQGSGIENVPEGDEETNNNEEETINE